MQFKFFQVAATLLIAGVLIACGGGGSSTSPEESTTPQPSSSRFIKMDGKGNLLPGTAGNWSCVVDKKSGLLWEVKTDDGGLRDKDWVYTAFETTGTNGNGVCDATKSCNHAYFRDAVNATRLCGYSDWRLVRVTELEGLQDSSRSQAPYIDVQFFPFTSAGKYWTTSEYTSAANQNVWWVDFASVYSNSTRIKDLQFYVRLVRAYSAP